VVRVTIYNEPDEGFKKLKENASIYENLLLNSHVMMRGVLDKNHDIISIGGMLYEMCITFQDEVYFNGMKAILDSGKLIQPFTIMNGQILPLMILLP